MMSRRRALLIAQQGRLLPTEYQQVEYINGGGRAYIDTGIYLTNDDAISVEIKTIALPNNSRGIMGARSGFSDRNISISHQPSGYGLICDFNNGSADTYRYKNTTIATGSRITLICNKTRRGIVDVSYNNTACTATFTCSATCRIGATNGLGDPYTGDILGAEIEGKFKGIPCYNKSTGVIGMYDLISKTFFVNAGTGSFTKGADIN